jgi:hypothetical protein
VFQGNKTIIHAPRRETSNGRGCNFRFRNVSEKKMVRLNWTSEEVDGKLKVLCVSFTPHV